MKTATQYRADLSNIFSHAWKMAKLNAKKFKKSAREFFGRMLAHAFRAAGYGKNAAQAEAIRNGSEDSVDVEPALTLQNVVNALSYVNNYYNNPKKQEVIALCEQLSSNADAWFAAQVASTVARFRKASEKQLYVIARYIFTLPNAAQIVDGIYVA